MSTVPAQPLPPSGETPREAWDAMNADSQAYHDELALQTYERAVLARAKQHRSWVPKADA